MARTQPERDHVRRRGARGLAICRCRSPPSSLPDRLWAPRQRVVRERTVPVPVRPDARRSARSRRSMSTSRRDRLRFPYRKNNTLDLGDVLGFRHRQMDRDGELHAGDPSRSRARRPDRRRRGAHRQGAASRTAISTAYSIAASPRRSWTNLRDWHELYCARPPDRGGGRPRPGDRQDQPARHRAPPRRSTSQRLFGPGRGPAARLLRPRGDRAGPGQALPADRRARYLDLARYFIDERGRQPHYFDIEARCARRRSGGLLVLRTYEYNQIHVPVREQDRVVGHAVRAMYLYSAMADLAAETATRACWPPAGGCGPTSTTSASTSPAASGPRRAQRGLHHRLRSAQRDRLRRNLRLGRPGVLGAPHGCCSRATAAMPTSWSRRSTTTR